MVLPPLLVLQRRRQYMQQHPAHLPESLYLAGRGFVMGVALGLSGVVVHPFRGELARGQIIDPNVHVCVRAISQRACVILLFLVW